MLNLSLVPAHKTWQWIGNGFLFGFVETSTIVELVNAFQKCFLNVYMQVKTWKLRLFRIKILNLTSEKC